MRLALLDYRHDPADRSTNLPCVDRAGQIVWHAALPVESISDCYVSVDVD